MLREYHIVKTFGKNSFTRKETNFKALLRAKTVTDKLKITMAESYEAYFLIIIYLTR